MTNKTIFLGLFLLLFSSLFFAQNNNNTRVKWQMVGDETFPEFDSGWYRSGSVCGIGQVRTVAVDPNNNNHLVVGTVGGGVWETFNALTADNTKVHWTCLTDDLPVYTVARILLKNNTIYASSSSHLSTKYTSSMFDKYGLGVIKKDLNADDWEIANTTFNCDYFDVIAHNGSAIIYAIGNHTLYKSYDDGKTWEELTSAKKLIESHKMKFSRLIIKPNDPNTVFLMATRGKAMLFKTTDGGKTWVDQSNIFKELLTYDFSENSNSVEAFYDEEDDMLHLSLHSKSKVFIITSTDWEHFGLYNKNPTVGLRISAMINTAFVKINETDYLYGATRLHKLIEGRTAISLSNNEIHDDIRAIQLFKDTENDETITYIGHDGGIAYSKDFGKTFVNISGNLNLFQSFNMAYNNHNGHRIITIGVQDGTWYRLDRDGSNTWDFVETCCEGAVFTQPDNPDITYFNSNGTLKRTDTGVVPIAPSHTLKTRRIEKINDLDAPVTFHPDNPETIVYSKYLWPGKNNPYGNTLEISFDKGDTAHKLTIENGTTFMKGRPTDMAFCKADSDVFYFSSLSFKKNKFGEFDVTNHLYKTNNMNDAVADIVFIDIIDNLRDFDADVLDKTPINDIEVSDTNPNDIWLSFGNITATKKIYHSNNGGTTWENISYNLPNAPVNRIKYDAINEYLYVGTDLGVYILGDKNWQVYGKDLPIAIISDMALDPISNELVACTFGRSVWVAPLKIACKDIVIVKNTTLTEDITTCGSLIVKNAAKLTIKNACIKVNNVQLIDGSRIKLKGSGELISKGNE